MKRYKNDQRLKGKQILVVEDCPNVRELVSAIFTHSGAETIETKNGKEALEMLSSIKPDMILMDIHMPVVNGITASKVIKNCDNNSSCPIILFSSDHIQLERMASEPPIVEDYICKPFRPVELLEKTIRILSKQAIKH